MRSSAAPFPTAHDHTACIAVNRRLLTDRPLLLPTCPRCAQGVATRTEHLRLSVHRPAVLLAALGVYVLAIALAARAPDFVWYHSLLPRELYGLLLDGALGAVLLVPLPFVLAAGVFALRPRRLHARLPVCASCERAGHTATLLRGMQLVVMGLGGIGGTLAARELGLPPDLGLVAFVPLALLGAALYGALTSPERILLVRATRDELVLRTPRTVARVLKEAHPVAVRLTSAPRALPRWLAPVLTCAAIAVTFVTASEETLVCPPDTRGELTVDGFGFSHEYCVDDGGALHGRYLTVDSDGELLTIGGFDGGQPSGTWAERESHGWSLRGATEIRRAYDARFWALSPGRVPMPAAL